MKGPITFQVSGKKGKKSTREYKSLEAGKDEIIILMAFSAMVSLCLEYLKSSSVRLEPRRARFQCAVPSKGE
jgi:hypothetical protein